MSKILQITEKFPLDKFEGLTRLIISLRGKFNTITLNNKNGYIRVADADGHLFIARTLLKNSPERARENEETLCQITYEMVESSNSLLLKKRKTSNHENSKKSEEIICAGIEYDGRFFSCGGLVAHENLALLVLFLAFAIEEYFSPNPVPNMYLDRMGNLLAEMMNKSEMRSTEAEIYKKAIQVINEVLSNKRTIWPTGDSLFKK